MDFDQVEASFAQFASGSRIACREDRVTTGSDDIRRMVLARIDREWVNAGELRGIDARWVV
jgi:hypothetical protein